MRVFLQPKDKIMKRLCVFILALCACTGGSGPSSDASPSMSDAAGPVTRPADAAAVPPFETTGLVGSRCRTAADCNFDPNAEDEECYTQLQPTNGGAPIDFPGGYCSRNCIFKDCVGGDVVCLASNQGFSFCAQSCFKNSDCREAEGYVCQGGLGFGSCVAP